MAYRSLAPGEDDLCGEAASLPVLQNQDSVHLARELLGDRQAKPHPWSRLPCVIEQPYKRFHHDVELVPGDAGAPVYHRDDRSAILVLTNMYLGRAGEFEGVVDEVRQGPSQRPGAGRQGIFCGSGPRRPIHNDTKPVGN